jgi:hypothetical protein
MKITKNNNQKITKDIDEFLINGILYIIPNKYLPNLELGIEQQGIFKFILAFVIHNNRKEIELEQIDKKIMEKYIVNTEKIFAYCITGFLDNIKLQSWEQNILHQIPNSVQYHLNPIIIERQ